MPSLKGAKMDILNILDKKIERKKFFAFIGGSAVSYFVLKSFPLKLFKKNLKKVTEKKKIIVKANSLAVQRKKAGNDNV
jgi:hypothetical protein